MTFSAPAPANALVVSGSGAIIHLPGNGQNCALGQFMPHMGLLPGTSAGFTTANTCVIYPFYVWESVTVEKVGWLNGSAAGGNSCVALYNAALARLTTTGSVARAGNSVVQWVDVANVTLSAGLLYYAAINHDVITGNQVSGWTLAIGVGALAGVQQQVVGALVLPDPLVPSSWSGVRIVPSVLLATIVGVS